MGLKASIADDYVAGTAAAYENQTLHTQKKLELALKTPHPHKNAKYWDIFTKA